MKDEFRLVGAVYCLSSLLLALYGRCCLLGVFWGPEGERAANWFVNDVSTPCLLVLNRKFNISYLMSIGFYISLCFFNAHVNELLQFFIRNLFQSILFPQLGFLVYSFLLIPL